MADFEDRSVHFSFEKLISAIDRAAVEMGVLGDVEKRTQRSAAQAAKDAEQAAAAARRARREAAARLPQTPGVGQRTPVGPTGPIRPPQGYRYAAPPGGAALDPLFTRQPPPPRQIGPGRPVIGQLPVRTGPARPGTFYDYQGQLYPSGVSIPRADQYRAPIGPPQGVYGPQIGRARARADQYRQPAGPEPYSPGAMTAAAANVGKLTNSLKFNAAQVSEASSEAQKLAAAQRGVGTAYAESASRIGAASNEIRSRGALTTEYLSALGRGETTIRELGYQVSATIGKFAGWTAAAAAVYGAAGAFNQLYQGALKAEDGVKLVERVANGNVNADALKQSFRDLSGEFNLPIETTADTVYQLTKLFGGDLPKAIEASRVSLQAMQVGELDVTEATNALNSVVKGFGLNVGELQTVFDAVNSAQNQFGGNTGELLKNVAKGAAQARQAGFSYKELIALQTTAVQYGGRTPSVAQTAISRSQSVILTQPGKDRLKDIGIDPDKLGNDYSKILELAAKKFAAASPTGQQQIARALVPSGGQFAPVFNSLLGNYNAYGNVLRQTSDETKNAGLRQKELAKFLESPSQQIKELGVNLQRLGSSLGESGALAPFILLVKTLNLALEGANALFESFNRLPLGLSKALIPLVEIVAALKLARSLDVGGSLTRGDGSRGPLSRALGRSDEANIGKTVQQGIRDRRNLVAEDYRTSAAALGRAELRANIARQQLIDAETVRASEKSLAAEQAVAAAKAKLVPLEAKEVELKARVIALETEAAALDAQANAYRAARNRGLAAEAAAAQAGITVRRRTPDTPTIVDPTRKIGAAAAAGEVATAGAVTNAEAAAAGATIGRSRAAWEGARQKASGLKAAVKGVGSTIAAYGNELLLAAFLLPPLVESLIKNLNDLEKALDTQGGNSPAELRRQAEALKPTLLDRIGQIGVTVANLPGNPIRGALDANPVEIKEEQRKRLENEAKGLEKAQRQGYLLPIATIEKQLGENLSISKTSAERERALEKARLQLEHSLAAFKGGKVAKGALAKALKSINDQLKNPDALKVGAFGSDQDQKAFEEAQKRYDARTSLLIAQARTPTGRANVAFQRADARIDRILKTYGEGSVEYLKALAERQSLLDAKFDAQQQLVDAKLSAQVASQTDPIAALRIQIRANVEKLGAIAEQYGRESVQYQQALAEGRNLSKQRVEQEISRFQAQVGLQAAQRGTGGTQGQQLLGAIGDAQKILGYAQSQGAGVDQLIQLQTQVQQARNAYADYLREQATQLIDARAGLASSRTEDPVKKEQIELNRLISQAKYARTPVERINARAQINEQQRKLRQERYQAQYDDIEFLASIGKIDKDTEIGRLQTLLGKIKGDKQLRRQIQQRLYQLKQESESDSGQFDLDVGALKLPSIYDVRKAFDPIREQVKSNLQKKGGSFLNPADLTSNNRGGDTTQTTVNVYVSDKNDAPVVYEAIDRAVRTNVRARMRSRKQR